MSMVRFEDLLEKARHSHPNTNLDLLRNAYAFSARAHKEQVRRSGEPYLSHPLEVASILAELKLDVVCVSVGLLHDVVEDTLTTVEKIREHFGEDVAHLVDGVTKISQIRFSSQRQRQAENFRKLLLAMVDDIRVMLVKLADRLHNMRTLEHLPLRRGKSIAQETLDIYAPIAHRLGMAKIRSELEDLAFRYLDPVSYQAVVDQTEEHKSSSERFIQQIRQSLQELLQEQGIEADIEGRTKRVYSVHQKMKRQRIGLHQVYDFVAIRVLVKAVPDCYAVLGIVNNMWSPVPGRIKDFIAMPRPNMYQALHTTVIGTSGQPFEIQIRTRDMHRVAEEGIAAHWRYKEGRVEEDKDDKRFLWLRHLLEWQQEVKDPHQFLSNLKIDLYPEEVYAFTPKGEVMALPRGATVVDFAYSIHTEVGHECVGAKVNGRIVPLKHRLRNGEIVEILTSKGSHPSRDWLNVVKSTRARSQIRRWVNLKEKERAVELGQNLLEKEARKFGLNLKKYEDTIDSLLPVFSVSRREDLLAGISYGKIPARQVLTKLEPEAQYQEAEKAQQSKLHTAIKRVLRRTDPAIQVRGHDDFLVFRAKCCSPIRGEDIIGYITVGRGISIHSANCPNVDNLLSNPERRVEVEWTQDEEETRYPVQLSIYTEDRTGVLADITSCISGINTNIVNVQARTLEDRYGVIKMTVEISDTEHLDKVMNFIKGVGGVQQVERGGRAS